MKYISKPGVRSLTKKILTLVFICRLFIHRINIYKSTYYKCICKLLCTNASVSIKILFLKVFLYDTTFEALLYIYKLKSSLELF